MRYFRACCIHVFSSGRAVSCIINWTLIFLYQVETKYTPPNKLILRRLVGYVCNLRRFHTMLMTRSLAKTSPSFLMYVPLTLLSVDFGLGQICRGCGNCSDCILCPFTTMVPTPTPSLYKTGAPTSSPFATLEPVTTTAPVSTWTPAPSLSTSEDAPDYC